jgi:hypothetical protein
MFWELATFLGALVFSVFLKPAKFLDFFSSFQAPYDRASKINFIPDFLPRSSRCEMYKVTEDNLPMFLAGQLSGNKTLETVQCRNQSGWNYDQRKLFKKTSF